MHEFEFDCVWDEQKCRKLTIDDNGKVVRAQYGCGNQIARAKMITDNTGILEWDVIIEKAGDYSWVGVCDDRGTIWALFSDGNCYREASVSYCRPFKMTKITVHLNLSKKTLAFTVNGTRFPEVPGWNNLPSRLRLAAGLSYPGRVRKT